VAGAISSNRFRIRIDHDRFEPFLFHSKRGVHATVVELNSLTDPIGATAEYHYLLAVAKGGFVFVSVGRIVARACRPQIPRRTCRRADRLGALLP
jgi:hypothetical protein